MFIFILNSSIFILIFILSIVCFDELELEFTEARMCMNDENIHVEVDFFFLFGVVFSCFE